MKKRRNQILNKSFFSFPLNRKRIDFFENLLSLLQPILPSLQKNALKQRITELFDNFPDIFNELKISDHTLEKNKKEKLK